VRWHCTGCGETYDLADLLDQMDDEMEAVMAYLHCDRI
jgi:hypothetical protein